MDTTSARGEVAVPETQDSMTRVADRVRAAFDGAELTALADLLAPDVRWGPPGDESPPCQSRRQVLAWYGRAKAAGRRARVAGVTVLGDRLLVELAMREARASHARAEETPRWQLLTVRDGRIAGIVGFDSERDARSYADADADAPSAPHRGQTGTP